MRTLLFIHNNESLDLGIAAQNLEASMFKTGQTVEIRKVKYRITEILHKIFTKTGEVETLIYIEPVE